MNGPEFKPAVPAQPEGPRTLRPGKLYMHLPLKLSQDNVFYMLKRLVADAPVYLGAHRADKVLLQVLGLPDSDGYVEADLARATTDFNDLMAGHAGSLFVSVTKAWTEIGIDPSERGNGMGQWDVGAFLAPEDVAETAFKLHTKFLPAFQAGLIRWYFSWSCKQQ